MKKIAIFFLFTSHLLFAQEQNRYDGRVLYHSEIKEANEIYLNAVQLFENEKWESAYLMYISATEVDLDFHYAYIAAATAAFNFGTARSIITAKNCLDIADVIVDKKMKNDPANSSLLGAKNRIRRINRIIKQLYY